MTTKRKPKNSYQTKKLRVDVTLTGFFNRTEYMTDTEFNELLMTMQALTGYIPTNFQQKLVDVTVKAHGKGLRVHVGK